MDKSLEKMEWLLKFNYIDWNYCSLLNKLDLKWISLNLNQIWME